MQPGFLRCSSRVVVGRGWRAWEQLAAGAPQAAQDQGAQPASASEPRSGSLGPCCHVSSGRLGAPGGPHLGTWNVTRELLQGQPIWPCSLRPAGSVGRRAGGPAAGLAQAPFFRLPLQWPSRHVLGCPEIHSLHSTGRRPSGWLGGPGARACAGARTEGGVTWDRLRTPARAWGPNSVSWLKG